jgi:hypothetical protein
MLVVDPVDSAEPVVVVAPFALVIEYLSVLPAIVELAVIGSLEESG